MKGYDVWLSNNRGNSYSLGHTKYDYKRDKEYWKFSFEEMANYDLPAFVKKIKDITEDNRIFYVGYGQGAT